MLQKRTMEMWVGLFVAAGLAGLAMLAFKVGNLATADVLDGYKLEARFDNIGGLKVKSAVTLGGVRIGRVSGIYYDKQDYEAVAVLNVDGRYKMLPKDTRASILTSGLLGEQYIGLEPGISDEYLKEGDRIEDTSSALVLEKLVGQFLYNMTSGAEKK